MNEMPGNPYADTNPDDVTLTTDARATLALAYEQRTANLIAAYGTSDTIEFDTILVRLGLLDGTK